MQDNHLSIMLHISLMALLTVALCSCAGLQVPLLPETRHHTQAAAELSFLNGDFQEALLEYEQIYDTALSPEDMNGALYGLACTQMILAQNDDQLIEAITNLQRWSANKGSGNFDENRNMLILALKQQSERIKMEKEQNATYDEHQKKIISNQRKKIAQMATTVEQLKNQLNELEAIDETYQEKRKP